ncbi:MAG: hypothetical protein ACKOXP_11025 [Flavobacteriales bacterium]
MKKLFIFLFGCLCYSSFFAQLPSNLIRNLESEGLKGKVRKISTTSFKAKKINGNIETTGKGWQYSWDADEVLSFDKNGLLKEQKVDKNGKNQCAYAIKLDAKKRVALIKEYDHTTYFSYDSINRICSSRTMNNWGFQFESIKYEYDKKNNLIKQMEFDSDELTSVKIFEYDQHNNLLKTTTTYEQNVEMETYLYNKHQQLMTFEQFDRFDGKIESTTYTYSHQQKIKEQSVDFEEGVPFAWISRFFENGNEVKIIETENGETPIIERNQYEYDEQGNWIKKTIDDDGNYFIVERSITYDKPASKSKQKMLYISLSILLIGLLCLLVVWYVLRRRKKQ